MSSLAVGRVRYGIMLREDGFVMDDGTAARLAPDRFVITTTTAHAVKVYQHMHFCHQVLWPELDVQFVSVTDQWAQFAVAGPRSRELLSRVLDPGLRHFQRGVPVHGRRADRAARRPARATVPDFVLGRARLRGRRACARRRGA